MSYANVAATPADRARAAVSVIAIHAMLGFGIVAGLTVSGVISAEDGPMTSWNVDETDPPPPPPDDIPPPDTPPSYNPPAATRAPIIIAEPSDIRVVEPTIINPDVVRIPGPVATPSIDPPRPTPSFTPAGPVPRNGPAGWITNNDYSTSDLRREREGTARYRLVVGSDGRVDACEITSSSGHASLDRTTCRLIESRARFAPATNSAGDRVVGTYTGIVTWRIPE